ncbi:MAG: hypothetical protein H0V07_08165, partial [Propionibacteriales bacterium]|nr:hypothetical protein [Propionibacteriales bacterium]
GGAPDTLWRRFCQVLDISPEGFDLDVSRPNQSLNTVDAEVLRRLNTVLPSDLPWPDYERIVKRRFKRRADSQTAGERLRVPSEYRDRVVDLAEQTRSGLAASGYQIIGDLDDLIPAEAGFGPVEPVTQRMVAEAAMQMLADVLVENRGKGRRAGRAKTHRFPRVLRRVWNARAVVRLREARRAP